MYYFLYKTTNLVNGKYYFGAHQTEDLNDGYLGSGKLLKAEIKIYGPESFKREIIQVFPTKEAMFEAEQRLISKELRNDPQCYNLVSGGNGGWLGTKDTVPVILPTGSCVRVPNNDPRYVSGELKHNRVGTIWVNKEGKNLNIQPTKADDYLQQGYNLGMDCGKVECPYCHDHIASQRAPHHIKCCAYSNYKMMLNPNTGFYQFVPLDWVNGFLDSGYSILEPVDEIHKQLTIPSHYPDFITRNVRCSISDFVYQSYKYRFFHFCPHCKEFRYLPRSNWFRNHYDYCQMKI